MTIDGWFILAGVLLTLIALSSTFIERAPLSPAIIYLTIGVLLGPAGFGFIQLDLIRDAKLLEHITEIVVLISVFCAGLKMATSVEDQRWSLALRLATISMAITVGLIATGAYWLFAIPLGAAILLGAMLAPTDAVLAGDVQVKDVKDRDKLRFGLTGEAGLNDGSAFPFVMLGLGLLALHPLGAGGVRWFTVDLLWASLGGVAIGAALGAMVGRIVLYFRRQHREALGLDEFLSLGLIALSYGAALAASTYGFLAVFAAGVALRRIATPPGAPLAKDLPKHLPKDAAAAHPEHAPAAMVVGILDVTVMLDKIGEFIVVILTGVLLGAMGGQGLTLTILAFIMLTFLVVRPLAVLAGLAGTRTNAHQRTLIAWFGIRGAGSLYLFPYAITHGIPGDLSELLGRIVLVTIAASIVVHGISVTPLMNRYQALRK